MSLRKLGIAAFTPFICLAWLAASAGSARAEEASLVGSWVYKGQGVRIEMTFGSYGQYSASAVGDDQKTQSFTGTYKVGPTEVVITPKDSTPITYGMKLDGDTLVLSGGDFGEGKGLQFSRRAAIADAAPPKMTAPPQKVDAEAPPKTEPKNDNELPGGTWDVKSIETAFKVLKTKYDPTTNKVTWLLERKTDGYINAQAEFYDEDDVKINSVWVEWDPAVATVVKGERVRASLALLKDDDMKRVKKVIIRTK